MPEKLTWIRLNPYVSVSCQPNTPNGRIVVKNHDVSPSIILLFGWMGARFHQVLDYADALHELFPSSTIVIISSWAEFVWRSQSYLNTAMIPVVELLQSERNHKTRFRGALVHIISNGGGWQFMTLRKVLSNLQLSTPPADRAPTALILDSVPDDKGLKSSLRAVSPTNPILRVLVFPFLFCLYVSIFIHNRFTGRLPLFAELRVALLQAEILPFIVTGGAPRLYVYSQSDPLVLATRVEQHIAAAAQLGLDVAVEEFEGTSHAAHMHSDPERYWSAVHSMWVGAVARMSNTVSH
ncbi:hypothetical protein B0F90DRAFT_1738871 [Multifurca ochricompacta]|uniref:Transmembrane protein 53 n=1 Tax=Multifurca ochricompacta TaxID=376703 RepID=A0AAD4M086_9AGAM|nr:hypothetical protein B0F90DRAFT_1738871 [Multifurca ochricompacta]